MYQETVPSFRSRCKWSLPSNFPPLLLRSPQKSSQCEKPIVTMETMTVLADDDQIIFFKCRSKHNSNKKNTGPLRLRYYFKVQTGNLEIPQPLLNFTLRVRSWELMKETEFFFFYRQSVISWKRCRFCLNLSLFMFPADT